MQVKDELLSLGNPEVVGELLSVLGVNSDDFAIEEKAQMIKDVLEFLVKQPDPNFFIVKAVGSKPVDRVEFMHEYINIHKQLDDAKNNLFSINNQLQMYDGLEPTTDAERAVFQALVNDKLEAQQKVQHLREEITVYEK